MAARLARYITNRTPERLSALQRSGVACEACSWDAGDVAQDARHVWHVCEHEEEIFTRVHTLVGSLSFPRFWVRVEIN